MACASVTVSWPCRLALAGESEGRGAWVVVCMKPIV
jgi:hypothetical protein